MSTQRKVEIGTPDPVTYFKVFFRTVLNGIDNLYILRMRSDIEPSTEDPHTIE